MQCLVKFYRRFRNIARLKKTFNLLLLLFGSMYGANWNRKLLLLVKTIKQHKQSIFQNKIKF